MKPSFLNLFKKWLTRDRVVPTISASVSWLILVGIGSGPAFLAEIRQQQEKPGEALFAGVEQLIDQVLFHPTVAREQVKHEPFGEPGLLLQDADHGRFLDPHDRAVCDRNRRCQSQRLPDQASLAEEV